MSIPMLLPAFTPAVAFLVVLWILYKLSGQRKAATKLPPGPAPWPIIGNFLELGKLPHRRRGFQYIWALLEANEEIVHD